MIQPMGLIQDEWAARARCPVCRASPLTVEHALEADRLACAGCGVLFEAEDGGPRIRLVRLPAIVCGAPDGVWRDGHETRVWLRALAKQRPPSPAPHPAPVSQAEPGRPTLPAEPPPPEPLTIPEPSGPFVAEPVAVEERPSPPAEALAQARQLFMLNHSLPRIKTILENSGLWTPEQVQAVIDALTPIDAQKKARERRAVQLTVGSALVGMALCGLVSALAVIRPGASAQVFAAWSSHGAGGAPMSTPIPNAALSMAPPTPTPLSLLDQLLQPVFNASAATPEGDGTYMNPADLPAPLQTLLPPGVQVINPPTPAVRRGDGPPSSACPRNKDDAAALFGGSADQWQHDNNATGWIVFSTGGPVTVHVPANMSLGYMVIGQDLNITQVNGPAVVENIYMGAILCE